MEVTIFPSDSQTLYNSLLRLRLSRKLILINSMLHIDDFNNTKLRTPTHARINEESLMVGIGSESSTYFHVFDNFHSLRT